MTQIKKLFLMIAAMTCVQMANAYEYPYLTFEAADGSTFTLSVESLTLMVADGKLVVKNAETESAFALADLSKMYFANSSTGISGGQQLASDAPIDVYSLSGVRLGSFKSSTEAQSKLRKGVYVVKSDGQTKKVLIR